MAPMAKKGGKVLMRILAIGNRAHTPKKLLGFTLIELLVVIFILGIASSFIIIRIGVSPSTLSSSENYSKHIFMALLYLQEKAILQSQQIAVSFSNNQMIIKRYGFEDPSVQGKWIVDPQNKGLKNITIPKNIQISFLSSNMTEQDQLVLFSSGDLIPFELKLFDGHKTFRILGYAYGDLKLEQL